MPLRAWLQERQYATAYHWQQRPNDEREYQLRTELVFELARLAGSEDPAYRSNHRAGSQDPAYTANVGRVLLDSPDLSDSPQLTDPPRLLDIGCGDARFTAAAASRIRAVGVDVSRRALGHARARVPSAHFVASGGAALPFASGFFDFVTLLDVIEHIPDADERRVVAEARRVLRPGGRLVISTNTNRSARELKHYRHYSLARFRSLFADLDSVCIAGLIPYFPSLRLWMAAPVVWRLAAARIRRCAPEAAHVVVGSGVKR